jgi:hypothetical protein
MRKSVDVLIVLGHELHVRNFVASGWLPQLLERGVRVAVVAPEYTVDAIGRLTGQPGIARSIEPFSISASKSTLLQWLRLASWYQGRRRHIEYRRKVEWQRPTWRNRARLSALAVAARVTDPERVIRRLLDRLPIRRSAQQLIAGVDPAVVFWPTTLSHTAECDIIQAARRDGRRVVMFEGSWDNLVGKGPVWPRPTRLLVWGELSRSLARERHAFADSDIVVTGPPHFDVYGRPQALPSRVAWLRKQGLDPARRVIFFGGSTVETSSEPPMLRLLSDWISTGVLPPAYVWYRPHPRAIGRQAALIAEVASIPHVVVDPGVPKAEHQSTVWVVHPADARQRAEALAACDVVLSSFSTVVVEAALLGKPSLLVAFGLVNGGVRPQPSKFADFAHVQYLSRSPSIRFAHSPAELQAALVRVMADDAGAAAAALRDFGLSIAHVSGEGAGARILNALLSDVAATERGAA